MAGSNSVGAHFSLSLRSLCADVCTAVLLIEDLQIKYYSVGFKEFERKKVKSHARPFATDLTRYGIFPCTVAHLCSLSYSVVFL